MAPRGKLPVRATSGGATHVIITRCPLSEGASEGPPLPVRGRGGPRAASPLGRTPPCTRPPSQPWPPPLLPAPPPTLAPPPPPPPSPC
eukprot:9494478-Pyramimonas_sp.AAC.1